MEGHPTDRGRLVAARARIRGRDAEIGAIERLLEDARGRRRAGVMVLVGEPGYGKSTLLEQCAALADGMRVLRCVGAPAEAALPFAGLFQMVRPLLGLIDRLPAPQAGAVRGAFGLSADRVEDRFLISVAALSLLSEAAEDVPLVCLVDEVGYLDQESADTLAFVARRLETEPIAFFVALTDEEARRFTLANAIRFRLAPLGEEDALALVQDAAASSVSPAVAERIVEAAAGVPLWLTELVASLTGDQLEGRVPLQEALPVSSGVEDAYLRRVRDLPPSSQTALLVAAATEPGELRTISAALGVLGIDAGVLDNASRAGLIEVGDPVRFPNPAVRFA